MNTEEKGRRRKTVDSLQDTLDKLVNVKKPAGEAYCPPTMKRATRISRDILAQCKAILIESISVDGEETIKHSTGNTISDVVQFSNNGEYVEVSVIGERTRTRFAGVKGLHSNTNTSRKKDMLKLSVAKMSDSLSDYFERQSASHEKIMTDLKKVLSRQSEQIQEAMKLCKKAEEKLSGD